MKLNTKKTIYVGFAFLLICMFWQVYDNVIAKMLIDSFGLNQTLSGLVMAADNIFAIILLPVFGVLSDRTKTKMGRRTPYILIGTICASLLIVTVSIFDNLQRKQVEEAQINPVVTVASQDYAEGSVITVMDKKAKTQTDISLFFSKVFSHQEDDLEAIQAEIIDGKFNFGRRADEKEDRVSNSVYGFTYQGTETLYRTKELAASARSFHIQDDGVVNGFYLAGFLVMLCLVLVSMSIFRTPAVSLMPDVTPKPLRSKANAIINLMGSAGGVTALILTNFLAKEYRSYTLCFIVLGALMLVALAIFLLKVNEPKLVAEMHLKQREYGLEEADDEQGFASSEKMPKDVARSFGLILASIVFWFFAYNAATSKFSVYATTVLNTGYSLPLIVAQAAAIISYIPIGQLSTKIGRKKTILLGITILFSAFFIGCFLVEPSGLGKILVYAVMALAGIGWATINVNSFPMVVEMSQGANVGKYTGIYYTASMAAQIATPILSGLIMDGFGTMTVLFPYCCVFCVLAFSTMSLVKHGDSKPIPKKKLESFEALED
ncbi:SLC45 family MFS transporter [bacterium]|jgi:MFS family permease|nr:SLC45 family MFS transporter [bacterium]